MSLMKYRKEYEKLKGQAGGAAAAGTVDKDYQRSLATFQGTLRSFQNSTQRLGIAVGTALLPPMTKLAEIITPVVEGIADFGSKNPALMTGIVLVGGALAGLVVALPIIAGVVSAFGTLGAAITAAGGAGVLFGGVIAAITGPVGIAVLAIIGIGLAFKAAYDKIEWFRTAVNGWASGLMQVFSGIGQFIANTWGLIVGIFTGDTKKIESSFAGIGAAVQTIFGGIGRIAQAVWSGVLNGALAVVRGIGSAFMAIPSVLGNIFRGLVTLANLAFSQIVSVIKRHALAILGIFAPIPAMIIRLFTSSGIGQRVISSIIEGLKAKAGALFGWIGGAWAKIKSMVGPGEGSPAAGSTPPGRATGGGVRAGQPYVVGERRRELFVPGMDGAIIPRIARPVAAGGGVTINAPVTIHAAGGNAMEIRDQVRSAFEDLMAMASGAYRVALND
jgi:hypothetical protein